MNKLSFIALLLVTMNSTGMAQTEIFRAKLKKEVVPTVILEAIAEDFPEGEVIEYAAVPITIIDDAVYVHPNVDAIGEDFDTYMVTLSDKNGHFEVTYDKEGHLLSSVSVMKDVRLPQTLMVSIGRHFPGWGVVGDKEVMTSVKDGRLKTHYKVTLEHGKEKHHVLFDADGNIVRGGEKAKPHRQIRIKDEAPKM